MKLFLIAVGHRMPAWVSAGFDEYARRMPREAPLKLMELKPEPRGESPAHANAVARLVAAEAERIAAAYPKGCFKIVLDEGGKSLSTRELARRIAGWQSAGRDVAFVIGGADGVSEALKREADFVWSLSALTLPHGLARVIVAEQVYRAMSLLRNHPYHRG